MPAETRSYSRRPEAEEWEDAAPARSRRRGERPLPASIRVTEAARGFAAGNHYLPGQIVDRRA